MRREPIDLDGARRICQTPPRKSGALPFGAHFVVSNSPTAEQTMRFALASIIVAGLASPEILLAQTDDQYRIVDPFKDQEPGGGISANISDAPEEQEPERGFSFPKLSMPKLPKLSMPKWKLPKPQLPSMGRGEQDASRSRPTSRTTTTRSTANRNPPPRGPSAWEKFNNGTKSFFTKTKTTLMPWTADTAPATPQRPPTGSNRTRVASNANRAQREDPKPSIFSPFLPDKEAEEKRVDSTTDFLSLPRPNFD
jgi:hypothetical protein